MKNDPAHRVEMEARAARREERNARMDAEGPTPVRLRPQRDTTDVARVYKAKLKRDRRALKRTSDAAAGGWRR